MVQEIPNASFSPLGIEQERFYAERILAGRRSFISSRQDIDGPLDAGRLLKAIEIVSLRQPAMRTRLAFTTGGAPGQLTGFLAGEPLVTCQAVAVNSSRQFDTYARALSKHCMDSVWNIVRNLPYKLYLLRRSDHEHILLGIFDHIFFDHSAATIFEREIWQVYGDLYRKQVGTVVCGAEPDMPVYGQRISTDAASGAAALYWSSRYAVAPLMWQPTCSGFSRGEAPGPAQVPHPGPGDLTESVKALGATTGYTSAEICVAAFASLAFRLTGQDRIAVDVPLDSRAAHEKATMGMFTSVRPLILERTKRGGASLLGQVRQEMSAAIAHRHLSGYTELALRRRQEERWHLKPGGTLCVAYMEADESTLSLPDTLRVTRNACVACQLSAVDRPSLAFVVLDQGARLQATFVYAEGVVDRNTAAALPGLLDRELLDMSDGAAQQASGHVGQRMSPIAWRPGLSPLLDEEGIVCLHVDLAEVQTALLSHPLVTAADAWVQSSSGDGSSVVASVTTPGEVTDEELREQCRSWDGATQYMIPPATVLRSVASEAPADGAGLARLGDAPGRRGIPVAASPREADTAVLAADSIQPCARLGFGTMRLTGPGAWGEPSDRRAMVRILRRAAGLGVDFFDTADSYGPLVSEEIVAEALHPYSGVIVATKGGLVRTGPDEWHPVGRPEYLRQCVEMSLRRLRRDTIELYYLHRIDPAVPLADQLGVLNDMRKAGKIVRIGLCEVTVQEIAEARLITPIASVQNRYNILNRRSEDVLDYCEREGLTFVPWAPVNAGRLTGPASPLSEVSRRANVTPVQFALAWLLRRSSVMLPIPGTTSMQHLAENMTAATLDLTQEQFESVLAI
jgi:pyridoxine 4-dehydrogenase